VLDVNRDAEIRFIASHVEQFSRNIPDWFEIVDFALIFLYQSLETFCKDSLYFFIAPQIAQDKAAIFLRQFDLFEYPSQEAPLDSFPFSETEEEDVIIRQFLTNIRGMA
jgi:hypothetical protein